MPGGIYLKYLTLFRADFYNLFFYWIVYSFLGWALETIYASIKNKKFINRGFLFGPLCPVYGFGALILIVFSNPIKNNIFSLFLFATVAASALEYFTGYILETAFKTTWWDYSHDFLNIKGRICITFSILWGIGSVIFMKYIHPIIINISDIISTNMGYIILQIIFIVIIVDLLFTLKSLTNLNNLLSQLNNVYIESKFALEHLKDFKDNKLSSQEYIFQQVKDRYENILKKIKCRYSRLTNAFPQFTEMKINQIALDIKNKFKSNGDN